MVAQTFLVIDEDLLVGLYSLLSNPFVIGVFVLLVGIIVFLFIGRSERREKRGFFDVSFERQKKEKSSGEGEKESIEDKLKGKEEELKKKEEDLKERKRMELADRERMLRKKELEERVKRERKLKEREISLLRHSHRERVSTHEWVRPSGVGFDYARGYVTPAFDVGYSQADNFLVREKERITGLIDSAVERFHDGGLDEGSLYRLVLDYQKQLLDVEIRLSKSAY